MDYSGFQYEIYEEGVKGTQPPWPVDEPSLKLAAQEVMTPEAFSYVCGDAGIGDTARSNRRAFEQLKLVPRVLTAPFPRNHEVTILGTKMPVPIIMAPIGVQKLIHNDGEVGSAQAAQKLGLTFIHSTASTTSMEDVANAVGKSPRWYQMYVPRNDKLALSFIKRATTNGYTAIVITLDTTTRAWRPSDLNLGHLPFLHGHGIANYLADPVFLSSLETSPEEDLPAAIKAWRAVAADPNINWDRIAWIRQQTNLPIVLKGILHPDDAKRAVEIGVNGVVVSNHGGRQLDGAIAAIDALPRIVDAVGHDTTILFDSGIRSGADAVKALALGAQAILLGRPWIWGLGLGGRPGAEHAMRAFLADYDVQMGLLGHRTPGELSRDDIVS